MLGKLNVQEIEELIKSQFIGRIGCHADNVTYVVPISYAYDGHYIYGYTSEGMKVDIMRKNPRVCFETDDTSNLANWRSVIAQGEFEELKDGELRNDALQKLHNRVLPVINSETMRISPLWPFSLDEPEKLKGVVYRIRLVDKTGRFEASTDGFFYAT